MITASKQGRCLELVVQTGEGERPIAPFVLSPLAMNVGRDIADIYIGIARRDNKPVKYTDEELWRIVLDGADPETGMPWRDDDGEFLSPNYDRAGRELTNEEGEELMIKALMWHSIIGMDGIEQYDLAGGGVSGALKATSLLAARMVALPSPTSPSSVSANPTQTGAIRDTSIRPGGGPRVKKPRDRLSKQRSQQG